MHSKRTEGALLLGMCENTLKSWPPVPHHISRQPVLWEAPDTESESNSTRAGTYSFQLVDRILQGFDLFRSRCSIHLRLHKLGHQTLFLMLQMPLLQAGKQEGCQESAGAPGCTLSQGERLFGGPDPCPPMEVKTYTAVCSTFCPPLVTSGHSKPCSDCL